MCSLVKMKTKKKPKEKEETKRHLSELRVLQRNLVYIIGVPLRIATEEIMKKPEFMGQFGNIVKVVINKRNLNVLNTCSVYVTFQREQDAAKAISVVDGSLFDGKILKATFGTTKYCSFFLRGLQCTNSGCMYLHEQGDEKDSFTKEEMAENKHHFNEDKDYSKPVQRLGKIPLKNMEDEVYEPVSQPSSPVYSEAKDTPLHRISSVPPYFDFSMWKPNRQFTPPEHIRFDPFAEDIFSSLETLVKRPESARERSRFQFANQDAPNDKVKQFFNHFNKESRMPKSPIPAAPISPIIQRTSMQSSTQSNAANIQMPPGLAPPNTETDDFQAQQKRIKEMLKRSEKLNKEMQQIQETKFKEQTPQKSQKKKKQQTFQDSNVFTLLPEDSMSHTDDGDVESLERAYLKAQSDAEIYAGKLREIIKKTSSPPLSA